MKQIIFILSMLLLTAQTAVAQGDGGGRVRNIRKEYVKGKLHLTEVQGQKFWPIYSQYLINLFIKKMAN